MEDMAGWREDNLRQEIANTQAKLQASEARLEEVRSTAEDAAKPLLRQIETLQSQMLANSRNWATVEQSLTAQVQRTIDERSEAVEKERVTSLRFLDAVRRNNVYIKALSLRVRTYVVCTTDHAGIASGDEPRGAVQARDRAGAGPQQGGGARAPCGGL